MATPFETFVNIELPKRPSTEQDPLTLTAGKIPVSTGVGLSMAFIDPQQLVTNGTPGDDGKSAYQIAVDNGYLGTEQEWLQTLKGEKGDRGDAGFVNLMGQLGEIAELPDPSIYPEGSAYNINKELWVVYDRAWVNAGDISGPKGDAGVGLRIRGHLQSTADLPQSEMEIGDTWIISPKMWVWDSTAWVSVGERGPAGASAYQIAVQEGYGGSQKEWTDYLRAKSNFELAVESGFVGTLHQWLNHLKGPQGPKGDKGDIGPYGDKGDRGDKGDPALPINLKGSVATINDLPTTAAESDGYIIGPDLHVWLGGVWNNLGPIVGPQGAQGPKGDKGDQGATGVGLPGDPGKSNYQLAVENGFQGTLSEWLDTIGGRDGLSAYEIAVQAGFQGSESDWLQSLIGPAGLNGVRGAQGPRGSDGWSFQGFYGGATYVDLQDLQTKIPQYTLTPGVTYFLQSGEVYSWDGADWVYLGMMKGVKGDKGDKGDLGPGLVIMGVLNDPSQLPASAEAIGDGYLIGADFWIWNGTEFINSGPVKGPKGDQGEQGPIGLQGPKGSKGDPGNDGNYWIVLPRPPGPVDGQPNDYFVNSSTLEMFHKVDNIRWAFLGHIGGGNVYDAPGDGKEYVRKNQEWVEPVLQEAPSDGKEYLRINGTWQEFIQDVPEAPQDGIGYVRKDGGWAPETQGLSDAPSDGKQYLRKNGSWTTPEVSGPVRNTTGELNLANDTVFTITVNANITVTLVNPPPSGKSIVAVVRLAGSNGIITWPSEINWDAGAAPVLGLNFTVVVLFFDGQTWSGVTSMKN